RRFLLYFAREGNSNIDLSILQRERKDIINEVLNARFSEAYHKFRYYVTQLISRDLIESIKGKGVNKTQRLSLVDMLDSLNGIFTPVTVREYKKRDC
ncbi:MAG: hypothetical protein KJ905_02245, partial [Nanoarchaeota archaeon]|nr:hypothetical protein [Nanoarchaeota archaeon]